MENKYYRRSAESELGEGTVYLEVADEYVVRQVEKYGDEYFWSTADAAKDARFLIADQSLDVLDLDPSHEVTRKEFERLWREAGGPR